MIWSKDVLAHGAGVAMLIDVVDARKFLLE